MVSQNHDITNCICAGQAEHASCVLAGRLFYHMICREAASRKSRQQDTHRHRKALHTTLTALADKFSYALGYQLGASAEAGPPQADAIGGVSASSSSSSSSSGGHVSKKQKMSSRWHPAVLQALRDDYIFHIAKHFGPTYDVALLEETVFELFDFQMRPPQLTSRG
jgi:hypothetical protein